MVLNRLQAAISVLGIEIASDSPPAVLSRTYVPSSLGPEIMTEFLSAVLTAVSLCPVRFGIAYFGVRDLDHARLDLAAIAGQGFSWVLLPFTHDDAMWEAATFSDLVASVADLGMDPVISPWGGAAFGGEGVQTDLPVPDWIARARDTGASQLHAAIPDPGVHHLPRDRARRDHLPGPAVDFAPRGGPAHNAASCAAPTRRVGGSPN